MRNSTAQTSSQNIYLNHNLWIRQFWIHTTKSSWMLYILIFWVSLPWEILLKLLLNSIYTTFTTLPLPNILVTSTNSHWKWLDLQWESSRFKGCKEWTARRLNKNIELREQRDRYESKWNLWSRNGVEWWGLILFLCAGVLTRLYSISEATRLASISKVQFPWFKFV